jgi:hypothetical protein
MNCRDVRELADSFLCEELLTETNHEILRHLDTCPSCRAELDGRRRLRATLRAAFDRAPALQPQAEFAHRLRERLREAEAHDQRSWTLPRRWMALAAGVLLAAGLAAVVLLNRSTTSAEHLAQDAIGDHQNCALKFRLVRTPIPLEEAARRFDSAYRLLLKAPPDDFSAPGGPARVVDRHSCAYGTRRFGHVVMQYRGHVVSLLMTANDRPDGAAEVVDAIPHLIGHPMNGLSVVSVNGSHHEIMLVSDLGEADLTNLSTAISVPLAHRLEAGLIPADADLLAAVYVAQVVQ